MSARFATLAATAEQTVNKLPGAMVQLSEGAITFAEMHMRLAEATHAIAALQHEIDNEQLKGGVDL